ncbi:MAG: hypothetical protein L0099_05055, partial [Acidobacteria bacterium]|nr:hypothetical protein [Acidobacteriota bacterium]
MSAGFHPEALHPGNGDFTPPPVLALIQKRSLIFGGAALALCAAGWAMNAARSAQAGDAFLAQFFRSYLMAYVLWMGVSLGCMAILMVQHLSGGGWGLVIRRILEAAAGPRVIPVMALLFLPIVLGMPYLYIWTDAARVAQDHLLHHKAAYLNTGFFLGRAAFYFAAWIGMAYAFTRLSDAQDRSPDPAVRDRLQMLSGGGLLLYGLTVSFAAVDWVMSLDPHWFSTIYGILFMGGQGVSAMCFVISMGVLLVKHKPMDAVLRPEHFHDLGKLLMAFVMLWAYFAFSQFLIIWSGNLPEEIPWYLHRLHGGWQFVALGLVIFHFALPFALLLSRDLKRQARRLGAIAVVVLAMRLVDMFWMVAPNFPQAQHGLSVHWLDLVAPIGIGGIWMAAFMHQLRRRPLLPLCDPGL